MDRDAAILPGYALEDFLTLPEHTGWSADTRDSYRRALQEVYAYLQSAGPPGRDTLAAWQRHLQGQGYRPRSINTRISAANNYFRWCGRYDLAMRHSTPNEPETPQLTRAEYLRLLCTARRKGEHRLYLLTKLFATTGLPLQCLPQVTVALVQAGHGTVRCRGSDLPFTLAPAFRQELLDYCRQQCLAAGPVFVSSRGRTINRSNLCRSMQELCRDAGVDEAKGNPRALRSLYQATQADIQARMDLLLRQAYDQLLQTEQTTAGWQEGA